MTSEKELPLDVGRDKRTIRRAHHFGVISLILIVLLFVTFSYNDNVKSLMDAPHEPDSLCPIIPKINPSKYLTNPETLQYILHNKKYHKQIRKRLSNAVKIPTEIYDDMINPSNIESLEELYKLDPRWEQFEKFQKFLKKTYPLIHKHLKLKKINKFGLIYTWKGSDETKKPIMLAAHQDVVPVSLETESQWKYPPFGGEFDGEFIYGRGVSDCKNLLMALMNTIELLLKEGDFKPKRTIILSFGYDEEASGNGAKEISEYLLNKYGENSIFQIIDEGDNEGITEIEGIKFILPSIGEKGHLNSIIELFTKGGHLSIPPKHTSIGILAELITIIENNQFNPILSNINPIMNQLYCLAQHSSTLDKSLKSNILKSQLDEKVNEKVVNYLMSNEETEYLIKSSQAVDIINGGIKSNALPDHVSMLINSRISIDQSSISIIEKFKQDILKITSKYNLGFILNNKEIIPIDSTNGYFNYTINEVLEPAPISPIDGKSWEIYSGSLRYLFEDLIFPSNDSSIIVSPYLAIGNTDTKSYWGLSENIYRYQPNINSKNSNIHTINEKLLFEGHLQIMSFYYFYLQVIDNIDEL